MRGSLHNRFYLDCVFSGFAGVVPKAYDKRSEYSLFMYAILKMIKVSLDSV